MKTLQPCQGRIKENIQNSQQIDWFQRKRKCVLKTTCYRSNAGKKVTWRRQSLQVLMDNPVFLIHNYCQTTLGNSHKLPVRPACIFILHILSPKLSEHQGATKLNMNSIIHNLRIKMIKIRSQANKMQHGSIELTSQIKI